MMQISSNRSSNIINIGRKFDSKGYKGETADKVPLSSTVVHCQSDGQFCTSNIKLTCMASTLASAAPDGESARRRTEIKRFCLFK